LRHVKPLLGNSPLRLRWPLRGLSMYLAAGAECYHGCGCHERSPESPWSTLLSEMGGHRFPLSWCDPADHALPSVEPVEPRPLAEMITRQIARDGE
jgi:hypothetical protein